MNEPRTVNSVNFTVILYNLESSQLIINKDLNFIRFSYDKSSCYNNIKVPGLVSYLSNVYLCGVFDLIYVSFLLFFKSA